MKILVINGANMNMLGRREPDIYGKEDYAALCARIYEHAQSRGVAVECFQSNHEGAIIDAIQEADTAFDGIVINPGAYTHYSYAIHDALKAVSIPAVEVHMSDIQKREEFRHLSVTAPACIAQIRGHGFESYTMAIDMLAKAHIRRKNKVPAAAGTQYFPRTVRRDMPPAGGIVKGAVLFRRRERPLGIPQRKARGGPLDPRIGSLRA